MQTRRSSAPGIVPDTCVKTKKVQLFALYTVSTVFFYTLIIFFVKCSLLYFRIVLSCLSFYVAEDELHRLYTRPTSIDHADILIDLTQNDNKPSKSLVIDLVDIDDDFIQTAPGQEISNESASRKRPHQSSSSSSSSTSAHHPTSSSNSNNSNNTKNRKVQNENSIHVLPTIFIPLMCPTPKSLTWTNIAYNVRCEDEPVLRYVPYFGDDDVTGVDVSAYDLVPGELEVRYFLIYTNKYTYFSFYFISLFIIISISTA